MATAAALRAAILDPLVGWPVEVMDVPEWGGPITVRSPSKDDKDFWLGELTALADVQPEDDVDTRTRKFLSVPEAEHVKSHARLFVRVAFYRDEDGRGKRLLSDIDVGDVAATFGPIHERVVAKAIEIGKLNVDPIEDGKNVPAETQPSA
ncbi:phage tail assembly chaperone [Burkholderia sp. 22PA0099]|uniref:phage tail assembly chaperone n=1 Tax=Burkholderia sp. 22PA0099 TaxID=3237372 RepID=UPI0039C22A42